MISMVMIFISLAYMLQENLYDDSDRSNLDSDEISSIGRQCKKTSDFFKTANSFPTEDREITIRFDSDDTYSCNELNSDDYSRINEDESNEVPNDINGSNLCGGFYYPGSDKKFIFANSPMFQIYYRISKVKTAIESFKCITADFQRKINQKEIKSASIDVLLFSLNTIGSFSDLSLKYIESYVKHIEDSIVFLRVGIKFLQKLISYAEDYCDGFEKKLNELNDKYRIFLQEIVKSI